MIEYQVTDPEFHESIDIPETTDTNHADNINSAPKEIYENTLVNQEGIEQLESQISNIAFSINEDDGGLDVTILDKED